MNGSGKFTIIYPEIDEHTLELYKQINDLQRNCVENYFKYKKIIDRLSRKIQKKNKIIKSVCAILIKLETENMKLKQQLYYSTISACYKLDKQRIKE